MLNYVGMCSRNRITRVFFLMLILHTSLSEKTLTASMQSRCGEEIQLSRMPTGSLRLVLTFDDVYAPLMNCFVAVTTEEHKRIAVKFLDMKINSFRHCPGDYLQIFDQYKTQNDSLDVVDSVKTQKYCGVNIPDMMTSSQSKLLFRFVSDSSFHGNGFTLLLTAYHEGHCDDSEYTCDNNRCIHKDLYCDDNDNCGDDSDNNCSLPTYVIAGIVVTSVLVVVAILFLLAVVRYRCKTKDQEYGEEVR